MKVKIVDTRHSIIEKCKKAGFDAVQGDYFDEIARIPYHVLCTASNPHFTFGGGIDAAFLQHFPFYCRGKQRAGGGNERIGNIVFAITVDFTQPSNEGLVREALAFARDHTLEHETLCICALGTGIGMMDEETFVELLKKTFKQKEHE